MGQNAAPWMASTSNSNRQGDTRPRPIPPARIGSLAPCLIGRFAKTNWNASREVALAPRPACMSGALPCARASIAAAPGMALHRQAALPASLNDGSYNKS
ncbi:hypothetical protein [Xanthomonas phaseoli]|uniref:Uncharacterized protein n=1 Tax=Xanthomonas manihotis TaxID=43353 RepID=A0A8I2BT68_XANMN|nr:hypothetical protein [Xanthomonas phaseoli]KUF23158.1 hypothetical protein AO826_02370 [Xanthomonas phaseoli pv. manihotis]MBO9720420.1 hypothetical protein [Xanthomonas phaseoli pv. manihotis]MBO9753987.1 hypothetical protein [Xanthomonas phaseoli pv. manihotis]MBO9758924.1 hypothetical protein [Xanthomonas phaseoli pv. manihotis]MBO9763867.1 hypothetical protein [Xanthomonas phaseoli pv. manihotis]